LKFDFNTNFLASESNKTNPICAHSKWLRKVKWKTKRKRVFSVELQSKKHLTSVSLTNGLVDSVLLEGNIGQLVQATFKEGLILEVIGKNGTIRMDLGEEEINKSAVQNPSEAIVDHD
jgi:hypothetical protein